MYLSKDIIFNYFFQTLINAAEALPAVRVVLVV